MFYKSSIWISTSNKGLFYWIICLNLCINSLGLSEARSDSPIRKFLIPVLSYIYLASFSFFIPLSDNKGPLWLLTTSKIDNVLLIEISRVFKFLLLIPIIAWSFLMLFHPLSDHVPQQ